MKRNVKIVSTDSIKPASRKSPVTLILESLGGDYKPVSDMAARYGVHTETIRRLIKAKDSDGNPKVKAPSQAAHQGEMVIYLFTEEDVKEMDEYMGSKGYVADA